MADQNMNERKNLSTKLMTTIEGRVLYFLSIVFFALLFSFYYYGIQKGFTPNSEDLLSTRVAHFQKLAGQNVFSDGWWVFLCRIAYEFLGLNYHSLRVARCMGYFLISFFTLDLCLRDRNWNLRLHAFPIYILFMVMMHLGSSEYYGQLTEKVHQYPFDNHMIAVFASVTSLWGFYYLKKYRGFLKKELFVLFLIWMFLCLEQGDNIYVVSFIGPIFLLFLKNKVNHDDQKLYKLIFFTVLFVAFMKVFSILSPNLGNLLFPGSTARYAGESKVYGAANFIGMKQIMGNILNYLGVLTGLFNFDFAGKSALSLEIVVYIFRFIFVCFLFSLVAKNIRRFFSKGNEYEESEVIMSFGFLALTIFFIFTQNGTETWYARYLTVFIPYGTIMLCWNLDEFHKFIHIPCLKNRQLLVALTIVCVLASFSPSWNKEKEPDSFDKDYEKILYILDTNGLHSGLANFFTSGTISALSEGRHMVSSTFFNSDFKRFFTNDSSELGLYYDFILFGKDPWDAICDDNTEVYEVYGTPDMIIETEHYWIAIYYDGIQL